MNERSACPPLADKWKLLFEVPIKQNQMQKRNRDKFNFHSEANEIFSKNFAVLNFRFLSFKRKEQLNNLFQCCFWRLPRNASLRGFFSYVKKRTLNLFTALNFCGCLSRILLRDSFKRKEGGTICFSE